MSGRRRLFLLLAALPLLAALLALGSWQVRRLHWKTALLADLATAEAAPPTLLVATPPPHAKLRVTGTFDHAREARLGFEVRQGIPGSHLLTPLLRPGAPPLLVDRGWAPQTGGTLDRPRGEVAVIGYPRSADTRDWNSPSDAPAERRFYLFDPLAIAAALELPKPEPFGLVALDPTAAAAALPSPARAMPRPDNPHLGYAITWFGLAAALVGVLGAVFWRGRRSG